MAARKKAEPRPSYVGPHEYERPEGVNTAAYSAEQYSQGLPDRVYDSKLGGYVNAKDSAGTEATAKDDDGDDKDDK